MLEAVSFVLGVIGLVVGIVAIPAIARWLEKRSEIRRYRRRAIASAPPDSMDPVERACREKLYYHLDGWARAVRLVGAGEELIPVSRIRIDYAHSELLVPPELKELRDQTVERRIREATASGQMFFDGPNTRLMSWRVSPADGDNVGREDKILELVLGPVGWYDFEGLNGAFRAHPENRGSTRLYEYYVGLSDLVRDGRVERSKLSNIVDNAVAMVTNDGYVGYQVRSGRVSLANGSLTSCIAENTNRYLDDAEPGDPTSTYNLGKSGAAPASAQYQPRGVPHPVAAVLRGIDEEVSPVVRNVVGTSGVYVTGISFDLEGLHPSLLFAVFVDLSHEEVLAARRNRPGRDYIEGSLNFVPADLHHEDTRRVLKAPSWIPSGQAATIRALEVLDTLSQTRRCDRSSAIRGLIVGDTVF